MEEAINFVRNRRKKLTKSQKNDLNIFRVGIGIFAFGVVVFLVSLLTNFYLRYRLGEIQSDRTLLEQQIRSRENVEESIIVTIEKLKVIAELFEQRYDKQAAIEYFSNIFGPNVLIKDIDYEADERILSLRIESQSIFVLEDVFERLAQPEVEEQFGQVNKSDLTRNDQGMYNMAITLSLNEEAE